jgi:hypothetical protein
MYTRIGRYQVAPNDVDEFVRRVVAGLVPLISSTLGFVSYSIMVTDNGDLLEISTFEDQARGDGSARLVAGWVKANLAAFLPLSSRVAGGEVRLRLISPVAIRSGMRDRQNMLA